LERTYRAFAERYPGEDAKVELRNRNLLFITFTNSPINDQPELSRAARARDASILAIRTLNAGAVEGVVILLRRRGFSGLYFYSRVATYAFSSDERGEVTLK
jgi:hypothetical protein